MKIKFDEATDAAYMYLSDKESVVVESEEVAPGIVYDYDNENHVVGIEILAIKSHTPEQLKALNFPFAPEVKESLKSFFMLMCHQF